MEESKKKRRRTMIPPAHLEKLEELFKSEPWPSRIKKYKLATELNQSEQFVSIWFQNRRARMKKEEPFLRFSKHQSNIDNTSNQYATNLTAISRTPSTTVTQIPAKNEHCHGVSIISKPCILKQGPVKNEEHTSTLEVKDRPINIIHSKSILNTGQTFKIIKRPMKIFIKPKEEMKMDTESSVEVAQEQPRNENSALTINNQDQRDENVVKCEVQEARPNGNDVSPGASEPPPMTLFRAIINMIAVAEGGIMSPQDPDFQSATNDALYGINMNGNTRLIYNKETGLEFVPMST